MQILLVSISLVCYVDSLLRRAHLLSSLVLVLAQNGVDQRKHRHLLEAAHALMTIGSLSCYFWVEVVSTSTYLIKIQPSTR